MNPFPVYECYDDMVAEKGKMTPYEEIDDSAYKINAIGGDPSAEEICEAARRRLHINFPKEFVV